VTVWLLTFWSAMLVIRCCQAARGEDNSGKGANC
jgi:hypothetical protein